MPGQSALEKQMAMAMLNGADSDSDEDDDDDYEDDDDDDTTQSEMIVLNSDAVSDDSRPTTIHHSVAPSDMLPDLLSSRSSIPLSAHPARGSIPVHDTGSVDARNLSVITEQEPGRDQESDQAAAGGQ